jgi:hypothetical protein
MNSMLKVAVVVAFVLAVGVTILPRGRDIGAAPQPSPSPSPSPTASPSRMPLSFAALEAGTYALGDPAFFQERSPFVRMTATVPEGWLGIRGRTFAHFFQESDGAPTGNIALQLPSSFYVDPCDTTKGLWDPPVGPTVDDFVTALADVPGYQVTAPTDVTLLGYTGKYVELVGPASVADCTDGFAHAWQTEFNETAQYLADGQHERLWILDIDGTRVVISLTGESAVPPTAGTDPASLDEQQQVLDSLRIAPAPAPTGSPSPSEPS